MWTSHDLTNVLQLFQMIFQDTAVLTLVLMIYKQIYTYVSKS